MNNYGYWSRYQRDLSTVAPGLRTKLLLMAASAIWMRNADGVDWYDFQKTLPAVETGDVYASVRKMADGSFRLFSVEDHWDKIMPLYMHFVRLETSIPPEELRGRRIDMATGEIFPADPDPIAWSVLEFLERFTFEERTSIRQLAKTDAQADDWLDMLRAAQFVSPQDARLQTGLAYLVSTGVITSQRKDAILL